MLLAHEVLDRHPDLCLWYAEPCSQCPGDHSGGNPAGNWNFFRDRFDASSFSE
jgi:hypothetical protein